VRVGQRISTQLSLRSIFHRRENISAVAVAAQESGFQVDGGTGLAKIAREEIDKRRDSAGIPRFALDAALAIPSSNGKSYSERLDAAKTEQQLSAVYEDFIGRVPFGKSLLADRNPIRTGGPMQVSIAFAEAFKAAPYPYPVSGTMRDDVFTRRGGMYFGIAHLLDYPAPYARPLYRFADFNAGQYASRNAAFQNAVTQVSGIPLQQDGDLLRYDHDQPIREPSSTELATRVLARRVDLSSEEIRRDLERGKAQSFEQTRLCASVRTCRSDDGKPAPRAVLPQIAAQPERTQPPHHRLVRQSRRGATRTACNAFLPDVKSLAAQLKRPSHHGDGQFLPRTSVLESLPRQSDHPARTGSR
jgi:hypothetical protein